MRKRLCQMIVFSANSANSRYHVAKSRSFSDVDFIVVFHLYEHEERRRLQTKTASLSLRLGQRRRSTPKRQFNVGRIDDRDLCWRYTDATRSKSENN
jgi:hypothetical protein